MLRLHLDDEDLHEQFALANRQSLLTTECHETSLIHSAELLRCEACHRALWAGFFFSCPIVKTNERIPAYMPQQLLPIAKHICASAC